MGVLANAMVAILFLDTNIKSTPCCKFCFVSLKLGNKDKDGNKETRSEATVLRQVRDESGRHNDWLYQGCGRLQRPSIQEKHEIQMKRL